MINKIRYFELSFMISLIWLELFIDFRPFCWSMPKLCLSRFSKNQRYTHNFLFGPFHTWDISCQAGIGVVVKINQVIYWDESPALPSRGINVFGFKKG